MKTRTLIASLACLIPSVAMAVPANPKPLVYTQPDGSEITLRNVGDEHYHYYLTDDNRMVLSNGDGFYFATPGADGLPVASSQLATNLINRSVADTQFLNGLNQSEMLTKASNAALARRMEKEQIRNSRRAAAPRASSANWPSGIGLFPTSTFPVTGSPKVLIILVEFNDKSFSTGAQSYFNGLITQEGFSEKDATGSAYDYFRDASNGLFTPDFDVLGPVRVSKNMAYYGANDYYGDDAHPEELVRDAMQLLDSTTDFSVYDTDNDGVIDNVYLIYAGLGEASGGSADTIWPHSWSLTDAGLSYSVDGKKVDSYGCSAEYLSAGLLDGIGTFCHEFSHVMGLPDLYSVTYVSSVEKLTPGDYSLMDYGSYCNEGRTPPTYSAYERNAMGWCEIEQLNPGEPRIAELKHILTSNKAYVIPTEKSNEFFLLENRQNSGWDKYLPGHGMLVWHVDYNSSIWNNNTPNNQAHQYVDIIEAGGSANNTSETTMAQYPFPGTTNNTELTSSTKPALKSWSGTAIDVPLTSIKESAGVITFDVCGGMFIPEPVCNISESIVESDDPVTITLSLPESAEEGDVIEYIYAYNDDSDLVEGTYDAPITVEKSCEFEYWTRRGDYQSKITNIKIYIGEEAPRITSYTIQFKENNSDSSVSLSSNDKYLAQVTEGADVATLNTSATKYVYSGTYGLKMSSSKNNGTLALNLASDYQKATTKVVLSVMSYSSESATISVNGHEAQNIASNSGASDLTFEFDGEVITNLTVSATKRLYLSGITVYGEGKEDPVEPEDPENPEDPTDPEEPVGDLITICFDFTGSEAYGLVATSDSDSDYNTYHECVEGFVTMTLMGNTRWWDGSNGRTLRLYSGANFKLTTPETHVIKAAQINGATASDWDKTSFTGSTHEVEFQNLKTSRVSISSVDVTYAAISTGIGSIESDDIEAVYYNLQGIQIPAPVKGQVCLMRKGTKVTKLL